MRLIVVRHATTIFNERGLFIGQHEDELSPTGFKQLPELVKELKDYNFTVLYSSTLKRALQTAKPISEAYDLPINEDKRLVEVDFGSFNSDQPPEVILGSEASELLDSYTYDFRPHGGESADGVKARVESFLKDIYKKPDETPLIVTHGGTLRWFYLLCKNERVGRQLNASVHVFDVKA